MEIIIFVESSDSSLRQKTTVSLRYNVPSKSHTLDYVKVEFTLYWNNNTYRIYTITQSPSCVIVEFTLHQGTLYRR